MGICRKIFIIHLHNLQMLFMMCFDAVRLFVLVTIL